MELDRVGLTHPEMPVCRRHGDRPRWTARSRQVERVAVPLQGFERLLRAGHDGIGETRPESASTGSTPTSGKAPDRTVAPRLAASSWAPRQTPKYGMPARTAAAIHAFSPASQGWTASSLTLIGPPIATTRSALAPVREPVAFVDLDANDVDAVLVEHRLRRCRAARTRCAAARWPGSRSISRLQRAPLSRAPPSSRPCRSCNPG